MLLSQNSKLKATSRKNKIDVYNFGIPAFKSKTGLRTCPNAGACASGCYAQSGAYRFSNVAAAFEARLVATTKDDFPVQVGAEILKALKTATKRGHKLVIRVHDSGDFYSPRYQLSWYHVARAFPEVLFYAYTKQVVQSVALSGAQPLNFTLIYSMGGLQDKFIQATDRHSKVFESLADLTKAGYADASSDDLVALGENAKIGLVYHHAKSYSNTLWASVSKA